jgi:hypothetical protein
MPTRTPSLGNKMWLFNKTLQRGLACNGCMSAEVQRPLNPLYFPRISAGRQVEQSCCLLVLHLLPGALSRQQQQQPTNQVNDSMSGMSMHLTTMPTGMPMTSGSCSFESTIASNVLLITVHGVPVTWIGGYQLTTISMTS